MKKRISSFQKSFYFVQFNTRIAFIRLLKGSQTGFISVSALSFRQRSF